MLAYQVLVLQRDRDIVEPFEQASASEVVADEWLTATAPGDGPRLEIESDLEVCQRKGRVTQFLERVRRNARQQQSVVTRVRGKNIPETRRQDRSHAGP